MTPSRLSLAILFLLLSTIGAAEEVSFRPASTQAEIPATPPCEVHVQDEPGGPEEIFPCRQPIELENPEAVVWLEQGGWISPFVTGASDVLGGWEPAVELRLSPGAAFTIPQSASGKESVEIRRYAHQTGNVEPIPFIRTIRRGDRAVLPFSPANSTLAIRYDSSGNVVAVTQPLTGSLDKVTEVRPAAPVDGADLFVTLGWSDPEKKDWYHDLDLFLEQEDKSIRPGALFRGEDHVIAVWYGRPEGEAAITVDSDEWYLAPQPVTLEQGLVTNAKLELQDRASIDVNVTLADGVALEEEIEDLHLVVRPSRSQEILAEAALSLDEATRLESLPPLVLDLILTIDGMEAFERVDLTSGLDGDVTFELDPIRVHGTVTHGDEPKRAILSFSNSKVETDDYGDYEAILWQSRLYILKAVIPGVNDDRPIQRPIRISEDRELDIRVPKNSFSVRVTDASTGLPIAGAQAGAMNRYTDPFASVEEARPMGTSTPAVPTDEAGIAHLPPLSPGTVTIYASAEGYAQRSIEDIPIAESDGERLIDVALQPESGTGTLTLRLFDGSPASGAAVMVLPGPDSLPVWRGSTDEAGQLVLPPAAENAALLMTHPAAGTTVHRWETAVEPEPEWVLPQPAPPLTVRLQHSDGTPAPQAKVVFWIDGHRFSRMLPRGATGQADFQGIWPAQNLPPQPLRIMAFDLGTTIDWTSPSTDALSQVIPYPWPAQPVVTVIE